MFFSCKRVKQRGVEMQTRRRRGNGAGNARVNGLIAFVVGLVRIPQNVGWQRHAPELREFGFDGLIESKDVESVFAIQDGRAACIVEHDDATGLRLFADTQLSQHVPIVDDAFDQNLDGATGFLLVSEQSRGNDARIVEDEQIAIAKIIGDVGELPIGECFVLDVDNQQTARRALRQRCLCDQFAGKIEVEIGFFQDAARSGNRDYRIARYNQPF